MKHEDLNLVRITNVMFCTVSVISDRISTIERMNRVFGVGRKTKLAVCGRQGNKCGRLCKL